MTAPLRALAPLLAQSRRVAILAVGSRLNGDDYAGMAAGELLKPMEDGQRLLIAQGSNAPENCTGQIRAFRPDAVLVLDAAHMEKSPGEYALLRPEEITGATFSTHMLPLPVTLNYLEAACGCRTAYIGIQPRTLEQGIGMGAQVEAGVRQLAAERTELLRPAAGTAEGDAAAEGQD